jgi:hypothetical protein
MKYTVYAMAVALISMTAAAGTANMNFDSGVGLLTYQTGAGSLIASGGRAAFTGQNFSLLAEGGTPISSGGTVSATMTLRPSTDAVNLVGLVMLSSGGDMLQATCDGDGHVTLTDYIGQYRTAAFSYPAAGNNYFTLTYSASTARATLTLNGSSQVFLEDALEGATSVRVGVGSGGAGGFESFTATGSGIPDYPPIAVDTDGDGVTDEDEDTAGTDANDPGSRPVNGATGATVTGLNGASVTFPAGSFSGSINVGVSTPATIPPGATPGGTIGSGAALSLAPDGSTFGTPVTVSMPYTPAQVQYIEESTLTPFYHDGSNYSAAGIGGVSVNTTANTVAFTTTHFSVFILAGDPLDSDGDGSPDYEDAFPSNPNGQTDTDDDGIGDEWEIDWFGDLNTADETTDYDGDDVSDLREFEAWYFDFDPTDGLSELPAAGVAALIATVALIAAAARRRVRRA